MDKISPSWIFITFWDISGPKVGWKGPHNQQEGLGRHKAARTQNGDRPWNSPAVKHAFLDNTYSIFLKT
jgi:hypothetical protein